ncbi:unnamed protein product [Effrenium voratum]|uniref:Uncharacterized protein n=1 Tax=Effrenium voratum TaxID=2562239 RepID=A0AA36ICU6_9DINO|nr:unnamed protein product [Effrenium voratum]CAJ1415975.1 unnamed protein product [Effrenium voratum]
MFRHCVKLTLKHASARSGAMAAAVRLFHLLILTSNAFKNRGSWSPNPKAHPASVSVCGDARFTFLTPRLLRVESRSFEDRATVAVENRRLPPPLDLRMAKSDGWCNITATWASEETNGRVETDASTTTVRYRSGLTEPFIEVEAVLATGQHVQWRLGDKDTGNLNGTRFDLAQCCTNPGTLPSDLDPGYPLLPGLLSRNGWSLLNDTSSIVSDWISYRVVEMDVYVFACGFQFRECLRDFAQISGPMSLPPLSAFGHWWSRHWGDPFDGIYFGPMTQDAITKEVIQGYRDHGLPLHQVVLDMEWHQQVAKDCRTFVGMKGWAGWTWNRTLFPDPKAFTDWLHAGNTSDSYGHPLKLVLNLHPDAPFTPCEETYAAFARCLGLDPSKAEDIELDYYNKTLMEGLARVVLPALHADYLWMDSPTVNTWKNGFYDNVLLQQGKRPLVLSRYGGYGNQRYPIGFSGDTARKWDTLHYQVYFTPTAANVGFGYWSHDIGGFNGANSTDHLGESAELNLRWTQFGVFSPIFRSHCRYCDQRIWINNLTLVYPQLRSAHLLRNALVPYIYTSGHIAEESGEALVHPCYFADPAGKHPETYDPSLAFQYFFGADMVVAPITQPVGPNGRIAKKVWLPPVSSGRWVRWNASASISSDATVASEEFTLDDTPVWVRAGAMIPTRDMRSVSRTVADPLIWQLWHGNKTFGGGKVIEDDGESMAYSFGEKAVVTASYTCTSACTSFKISVSSPQGSFKSPKMRSHEVAIMAYVNVSEVSVRSNGRVLSPTNRHAPGFWILPASGVNPAMLVVAPGPQLYTSSVEIAIGQSGSTPFVESII